jgi:archaemetzincin
VFGEAVLSGRVALISLWRLKTEFNDENLNGSVFVERAIKEAVHEVGHTLGLQHCPRGFCVMHFSNSIAETDEKRTVFCDRCSAKVSAALNSFKENR